MKKIQYTTLILYLILSIGAFFSIYPIYFMFVAATKSSGEIFMNTPPIFFGNYFFKNLDALTNRIPIWTALFNSLKVSIIFTFLNLFQDTHLLNLNLEVKNYSLPAYYYL